MLVLARGKNQTVKIGKDIIVRVVDVRGKTVILGIDAPKDVQIVRDDAVDANGKEARG